MTSLVLAPPADLLVPEVRSGLETLLEADGAGDVLDAVVGLVRQAGPYTEDANYMALDLVARMALQRIKLLTLRVVAPVVYNMRQTRGWARLVNPKNGQAYADFDDWALEALNLSHTRTNNLCTVHERVLPMAVRQGANLETLEDVDDSKLMLLAPLVQEYGREVDRVRREAEAHGTPPDQIVYPPEPDLRRLLERAKTSTWNQMRQEVLIAQGVQKEPLELEFLVEHLEDGRYGVYARFTPEQMLRLDEKLRPRWLDTKTRLPVSLHEELRSPPEVIDPRDPSGPAEVRA